MLLKKQKDFENLLTAVAEKTMVSLDTETTGLDWKKNKIVGCSIAHDELEGYWIPGTGVEIKGVIEDPAIDKVFHNSKFDMHFLSKAGQEVAGKIYDTYILMRLLDENRSVKTNGKTYKLKDLAVELVDSASADDMGKLDQWLEQNGLTKGDMAKAPLEILGQYAANDAKITLSLYRIVREKLAKAGIPDSLIDLESSMLRCAYEMEKEGMHLDRDFLEGYEKELQAELTPIGQQLRIIAGEEFNPESDNECRNIAKKLGWKPDPGLRNTDAGVSMDKETLKSWDHPFFAQLAQYRRVSTVLQTFVKGILERAVQTPEGTWKAHCAYNTAGADTGRWSSKDPNLQNQDKKSKARRAFCPAPGKELWFFDYKQIEPVIFAHFTNSDQLIRALQAGMDFHSFNAQMAFNVTSPTPEQRTVAKGLGLALMYQAGKAKAAKMMGVTIGEGSRITNQFHKNIPEVKTLQRALSEELLQRAKRAAQDSGLLTAKLGVWYYKDKPIMSKWVFKENTSQNQELMPGATPPQRNQWWGPFENWGPLEQYGWLTNPFGRQLHLQMKDAYKAVNRVVQSTAADALKTGMARAVKATGDYPLLQVHDELVFQWVPGEARTKAKLVKEAMESVQEFFPMVPIRVDVAMSKTNWAEEEEVTL